MKSLAVLEFAAASKRYGATLALDALDLAVQPGKLLALLGPNGAGKTTAIALALGLFEPDAGSVCLFGQSPHLLTARRHIGVMLQSAGLPDTLKVRELLAQTCAAYAQPLALDECVRMAGLEGLLERRYGKLSGGQQRRVQFALAICGRPRLLFLDEPTVGLDIEARSILWQTIRALVAAGSAVVLTTHYLEEAEALADCVAVLAHGRIVAQGSVAQVRARVAQKRIRCISTLDVAVIAAWPQVRSAARDGERIEIVTDVAEPVVRELFVADPALHELEVQRAGLAEAFVEITRAAA
ncbi:MAG: ABC transporter ATP-binding protein [Dokdonella sp.]|uniref:ABC transporter ATP-binding protein n=1 Tax=Dokdonella sp. TaxID=2291710 RepID=UPI0025C55242|nr:ABC transporter ATP-binding protein [Dokdonella sp.]MBZ0223095.1 ABC transporter ATP-binding protein [Dokdonella sp.]MCC7255497.1 ABC transporter ATP-binding protein [Dokdonella sp.]